MDIKEKYYDKIRGMGHRLTNNRIAMIEILENQHLTFKEIQKELFKRGYNNVASIYNNLEFLVKEKVVVELYIGNRKYYDLAMDNPGHSNESHIHISLKDTEEITEINDPDIFEFISKHPKLEGYDLEYIRIIIGAKNKDAN
ncbi:Fur family transcriptional regulator [Haploplasma axanthum]|uniref:Ferric uptake regulator family n=1 Tax=Haploplasma axanthum TaxID=29552 RepID=A0A449BEP4_HAPAX|nr:transcriptional repressor [Haploplasma axanthum]VEU80892.1 Ferric uptake regulator family [Haploplasma axanthum]